MKLITSLLFLFAIMNSTSAQTPPQSIDLFKYSGKWYVIGVIPTRFDKEWEYVTENYTVKKNGKIDIYTTYIKQGGTKIQSVKSKGFPKKSTGNVAWKVQFVWPFRADYLIEEIAEDYSYVVVGHPKKKFLYIMNRTGKMDEALYTTIVKRFSEKGYDITQLKKVLQ